MTDRSGVGVLTTDRHLIVRTWNHWLALATGLAEENVRGRALHDLAAGPTSAWARDIFAEVLGTGRPRVLAPAFHRYLISCPPHQPSAYFDRMQQRVTVAPLRDATEIVGLIVTIEDVTARLDAERTLASQLGEGTTRDALSAVGAEDWRLRQAAVRTLRQSASSEDIAQLIESLQRDHENLNVLSSALQVLVAADLDVGPPLIALLADPDSNLRMHAALALGELRYAAAVPALISALDDPDQNVRFHAIEALGRLAAPEAVEPLSAIAAGGDFFLAFAAIDALGKTDDARVATRLVGMLDRDDLRPAIVDTLATLGDEDCVPPLVDLLNTGAGDAVAVAAAIERIHARDDETYDAGAHIADVVRARLEPFGIRQLADALARREPPLRPLVVVLGWIGADALDALMGALGEGDVQATVDAALMRIGRDAVDPLLSRLETGTRQERLAAAALLGRLGDRRAVLPIVELLRSADADLVATAAGALAALGDPRAFDGLLRLFAHESRSVRQAAIAAVNSVGADATAARIMVLIGDANPRVRESAIRVGGYFGFDECRAAIIAAARDEHEEVRHAALEQLPMTDHPAAIATLLAALKEETPRNRAAVAHALRAVDDPRTSAPLQQALDDDDSWVRYFAADSVARRGLASAVPSLLSLAAGDPAVHVRIAALNALGVLDSPDLVTVVADMVADLMVDPAREADGDLVAAGLSALSWSSDPRVEGLLQRAVRSSSPAARVPAVQALATRPSTGAVEALAWGARLDDPPVLKRTAIEALGRIAASDQQAAADAAVGALLALGSGGDAGQAVLTVLGALPASTIPALDAALDASSNLAVRLLAIEALGRMRHPRASEALARALADDDPGVRAAAVGVFGRLGTSSVGATIAGLQETNPNPNVRRRAEMVCRRHGWHVGTPWS